MNISTRPPIVRMNRILEDLKAGRAVNCQRLGAELEVSYKTIQRDIDFLRDRLGIEITYEPTAYSFRIRPGAKVSIL